jgi:hypothetical protein
MKKIMIFFMLWLAIIISVNAADWISKPKLKIGLKSGYDSNILKVSSERDSNRVNGMSEEFNLSYVFWSKLNKKVKIYHSFRAGYLMLPGNTFANRWNVSYKSKLGIRLFRKRRRDLFPTTRLYILFNTGYSDKFYTDRALGEENIINVNNTPISLKDLFDNFYLQSGPELQFQFSKKLKLEIGYLYESNNFKNISEPGINYYYSLDNTQTEFDLKLDYQPTRFLEISPFFNQTNRTYKDKFDKTLAGQTVTGQKRKYIYKDIGIDTKISMKVAQLRAGYEQTKRTDGFEGYYDYDYYKIYSKFTIYVSSSSTISFYVDYAKKDYKNLSLFGQILRNTYNYFKVNYHTVFTHSMLVNFGFVYDKESSTYYKYTYSRWIPYFQITYFLAK